MSRDKKLPTEGQERRFGRRCLPAPGGGDACAGEAGRDRAPSSSRWTRRRAVSQHGTAPARSRGRCSTPRPRSAGSRCSSSTIAASASAGRASGVRDSRSLVRAMTAVHCLCGHHPDSQGAAPRPGRNPGAEGPCSGLRRRFNGGGRGRALRHRRRARLARGSRLHVPRRGRPGGGAGLSPDCAAHQRRLSALRCVRARASSRSSWARSRSTPPADARRSTTTAASAARRCCRSLIRSNEPAPPPAPAARHARLPRQWSRMSCSGWHSLVLVVFLTPLVRHGQSRPSLARWVKWVFIAAGAAATIFLSRDRQGTARLPSLSRSPDCPGS